MFKKTIMLLLALLSVVMNAQKKNGNGSELAEVTHFRDTKWGMTKAQVKAIETTHIDEDKGNTLVYLDNVAGFETEIVYTFLDGKLSQGVYYFVMDNFKDYGKYIENYNRLKLLLEKKYKTPQSDNINWIGANNTNQDNTALPNALYNGLIGFDSYWQTDATEIHLSMRCVDHKVFMSLNYETINLKRDLENLKLKSELQGL